MMFFSFILKKINCTKYWKKQGVSIGENTHIASNVVFGSEPYLVEIGNNCNITEKVEFITHDGGCHVLRTLYPEFNDVDCFRGKIIIGNNVYLGNHVCILPGVRIGNNCIIGYGSIITKNIPNNSVVAGVPGKVIETVEEYKEKNEGNFYHTKGYSFKKKKNTLLFGDKENEK